MEFFEAVKNRRSVRKYKPTPVPDEVVSKAIDAALIAPNSSNMQTWQFYWIKNPQSKPKFIEACLNQGAARTAQHLLIAVSNRKVWKRNQKLILKSFAEDSAVSNRADVNKYYGKLIPFLYGFQLLAPLKWVIFNFAGIFKATPRGPWSAAGLDVVSIKSCALACENFMLAISAQGFDTCPMEGLDESRMKRLLKLPCSAKVVMAISVGLRDDRGVWGKQFRLPKDLVVFER
jgi:nitroreductase